VQLTIRHDCEISQSLADRHYIPPGTSGFHAVW
jgi:hypothetical protein